MGEIEGPRSMTTNYQCDASRAQSFAVPLVSPTSPAPHVRPWRRPSQAAGVAGDLATDPRRANSADAAIEPAMLEFFLAALSFRSVSGNERDFVHFVAEWGRKQGFQTDLWQADEASLGVEHDRFARHIPLANRPTLVLHLPGDPALPSLLFNAHADVVAADAADWLHNPWSGTLVGERADGRVFGRGACDVKGPLASALWAMLSVARQSGRHGSVLLELIPGEEDCVGLGTLTSVARGWRSDAAVVLEPTGGLPRCASRGGCRFEIEILGRSVHGTVKWLGRDAIHSTCIALDVLRELESDFAHIGEADELFNQYPILRPITVDSIAGDGWQGMVCGRCTCAGYLELLPEDDTDAWQRKFSRAVASRLQQRGIPPDGVRIRFVEQYEGHRLDPDHPLCACAAESVGACVAGSQSKKLPRAGFNSGCEAGLRAKLLNTPTLVWGPGSLAQAHAADEYVDWAEVRSVADMFTTFSQLWTGEQP